MELGDILNIMKLTKSKLRQIIKEELSRRDNAIEMHKSFQKDRDGVWWGRGKIPEMSTEEIEAEVEEMAQAGERAASEREEEERQFPGLRKQIDREREDQYGQEQDLGWEAGEHPEKPEDPKMSGMSRRVGESQMKLTKSKLQQIIREELESSLSEGDFSASEEKQLMALKDKFCGGKKDCPRAFATVNAAKKKSK